MFCPQCGSQQSEELKFCKSCGANLLAVQQAVANRKSARKFDWTKTWVAEMMLSGEESAIRQAEVERLRGITPEVKRYNEVKAGVITGSAGLGLTIVLFVLMNGIILSGNVSAGAAEILSRLWVVGLIPLFVGIALVINGLLVSKRIVDIHNRSRQTGLKALDRNTQPQALVSPGPEFFPPGSSVTEGTTKHLEDSDQTK